MAGGIRLATVVSLDEVILGCADGSELNFVCGRGSLFVTGAIPGNALIRLPHFAGRPCTHWIHR